MSDFDNFRQAYPAVLDMIVSSGTAAAPRGLPTIELLGFGFSVEDSTDMLAIGTGRKLNTKFAAADALSVIGGFSDHEWASKWNPRIKEYGEHGAYGPRIVQQMSEVINRLNDDCDSRRAVVQVWNKDLDLWYDRSATDYPCTVSFQLMIRRGRLDMHVSMRANDAWYGLPYDVFTFSQLQCTIAGIMKIEPGRYFHHATSLHLYGKDYDAAQGVIRFRRDNETWGLADPPPARRPVGIDGVDGWWAAVLAAERIHLGKPTVEAPSTNWYKEKLS